jgi:hypothetical protein
MKLNNKNAEEQYKLKDNNMITLYEIVPINSENMYQINPIILSSIIIGCTTIMILLFGKLSLTNNKYKIIK